ncbi:glycoside hydrolase family 5 protein [Arcticibacter tournemirensis]|uniref:Glycoside hydrolase family 5 protein n=1 Tax=Arcticibacter tournemirensis TaxID=699437 RepID=A0A4Q0M8Y0_9SPHI|nr:glycoside hydrolase family 5 protein [Arcticibacter tournemirensis]RXF69186.1 glycoside hydrolase family 5 protein [Arcticibacter tournemirensis]
MNKALLILFGLLLIVLIGKGQPLQNAVELHGCLKVSNGKVVDKANVPPQLRGISFSWSIWRGEKYYNPKVLNWLVDDFGVNIVRLSMAVQPAGGYLQNPQRQKALVIPLIDQAIKKGIYVIVDWHDHNAELHKEEAIDFFEDIAIRYAGVPNILYEIWNEPERQSWRVIKHYAVDVISAIRKYDPKNLIVVGSPQWDQDIDIAAADPITGFENIAYSFHFYASDIHHQEGLRKKAEEAISKKLPLIVTEWGVGEANGDGRFDLEKTKKWLDWVESNQLSWINWNITDKDETTALLKPGASKYGQWSMSELTEAGLFIRSKLRELNERK